MRAAGNTTAASKRNTDKGAGIASLVCDPRYIYCMDVFAVTADVFMGRYDRDVPRPNFSRKHFMPNCTILYTHMYMYACTHAMSYFPRMIIAFCERTTDETKACTADVIDVLLFAAVANICIHARAGSRQSQREPCTNADSSHRDIRRASAQETQLLVRSLASAHVGSLASCRLPAPSTCRPHRNPS